MVEFVLHLVAQLVGVKSAVINIPNSDNNENPYNFSNRGVGTALLTSSTLADAALTDEMSWIAARLIEDLSPLANKPRKN